MNTAHPLQMFYIEKLALKPKRTKSRKRLGTWQEKEGCLLEKMPSPPSSHSTKRMNILYTCHLAFSSVSQECWKINKYIRTHPKPSTMNISIECEQPSHQKRINLGISSLQPWHMIHYRSSADNFSYGNQIAHNSSNILPKNAGAASWQRHSFLGGKKPLFSISLWILEFSLLFEWSLWMRN